MKRSHLVIALMALLLFFPVTIPVAVYAETATFRVSVGPGGLQADGTSYWDSSISADGRYVAFESEATNLVEGDNNGFKDIFVHDLQTNTTTCVSNGYAGVQSNRQSSGPSISNDGRYVAFQSYANNLVAKDTNNREDVFVHDRWLGTTKIVSIGSGGVQANGSPFEVVLSGNGRFVFFVSEADNLVINDTNGHKWDVFMHDLQTHTTSVVSLANDGTQANEKCESPSVSDDGRYVAFSSEADNLVESDVNNKWDVFVRDRETGTTTLVSISSSGEQGDVDSYDPNISADGRYVSFWSYARNFVTGDDDGIESDIFLHDRLTGETILVSEGSSGASFYPDISSDGRYVVFNTSGVFWDGTWIVSHVVFMRDLLKGHTTLISVTSDGNAPGSACSFPKISADGRYVSFTSYASNIVEGDTNGVSDIFVRGPLLPGLPVYYVDPSGSCNDNTPCYSTVQVAISSAISGAIIKILQGFYNESITLHTDKSLTLQGGWDTSFQNQTGKTVLRSAPKAEQGSLTLQELAIKPPVN